MTLVVGVTSPKSIWLLTDRRLSAPGRTPTDRARKFLMLETTDGRSLIGYSGLGATALGNEPGDWMSRVLRGRNLSVDQSIGVLAQAAKERLIPHIEKMRTNTVRGHVIVATAQVNGKPEVFHVDMHRWPHSKQYSFLHTRYEVPHPLPASPTTPRVIAAGSGAIPLDAHRSWMRPLLRMVRAYDDERVWQWAVARHLAQINQRVAKIVPTVGQRCIVSWFSNRGGGHEFYDGDEIDNTPGDRRIPQISLGVDSLAFMDAIFTPEERMAALQQAEPGRAPTLPPFDIDAINARLGALVMKPDESIE